MGPGGKRPQRVGQASLDGASGARFPDQQIGRHIIQEARGIGFFRCAAPAALNGADQVELVLGARDAHIKETALLFHPFGFVEGTAVRQDAIIQTDDEDHAELQSLGGVEGEKRGDIPFLDGVLVGDKRNILKEFIQRARGIFHGQTPQLLHVLPAIHTFFGFIVNVLL